MSLINERYRLIEQLGKGGFGSVWLAFDEMRGGLCALKRSDADNPDLVALIEAEATILTSVSHPALPRFRDHFIWEGHPHLVMDYIEGVDLGMLLATEPEGVAPIRVIEWANGLCAAVHYLHTLPQPILHRDIKPSNIKLTPSGRVILLDFGIAREVRTSTKGFQQAITAGYSPPEQYRGQTDARSDVYGLGATLYALLTGKTPTPAPDRLAGSPLVPPSQVRSRIPAQLDAPILAAMALENDERIPSAIELARALSAAWRDVPRAMATVLFPPTKPLQPKRAPIRRWLTAGLLGAAALGSIAVASHVLPANNQPVAALVITTATPTIAPTFTPAPTATVAPTATPAPTATSAPLVAGLQGTLYVGLKDDTNFQIYALDTQSGAKQRLTSKGSNYGGVVSPDGSMIAFTSERDGREQVYVMNIDGSNQRRISQDDGISQYPAWSPDGQSLVYVHSTKADPSNSYIVTQRLDQTDFVRVSRNFGTMPTWGKAGIVYMTADIVQGQEQLSLMRVQPDGTGQQVLNPTRDRDEHYPAWSPDQTTLAYVAGDSMRPETRQVWVMNADGSNPRPLTNGLGGVAMPRWSPDGKWIVFLAQWGIAKPNDQTHFNVWIVPVDGGKPKPFLISDAAKFGLGWGK